MQLESFDRGISLLIATFRDLKVSKDQLKTWRLLLQDITDDDFIAGIISICQSEKQIYPGTNIVAMIRSQPKCFEPENVTAELAWEGVQNAIASRGRYTDEHDIFEGNTLQAVKAIGWQNLCNADTGEINTIRAHFFRIFEAKLKMESDNKITENVRNLLDSVMKQLPQPENK